MPKVCLISSKTILKLHLSGVSQILKTAKEISHSGSKLSPAALGFHLKSIGGPEKKQDQKQTNQPTNKKNTNKTPHIYFQHIQEINLAKPVEVKPS